MDFRSDQTVPPNRDQPPEDLLVEEQETLPAEEMNGAGGERATPEVMEAPLTPPLEQHDTARDPELPSPEEFEHIMRTSGHYHRELEQLRRVQEEVLRRRLAAAEWQGDTTSTLECLAEAVLLWRIREMQRDLETGTREIGWILQCIVHVDAELAAMRYEAAVELCRTLAEQAHLVSLAEAQEEAGEGATTASGEGAASRPQVDDQRACLRCGKAVATVVVMPCNHLCLCVGCGDDGSVEVCPQCNGLSAGTVGL